MIPHHRSQAPQQGGRTGPELVKEADELKLLSLYLPQLRMHSLLLRVLVLLHLLQLLLQSLKVLRTLVLLLSVMCRVACACVCVRQSNLEHKRSIIRVYILDRRPDTTIGPRQ